MARNPIKIAAPAVSRDAGEPRLDPGLRVFVSSDLADPASFSQPSRFLRSAFSRLKGAGAVTGADLADAAKHFDALVLGAQAFGASQLCAPDKLALRLVVRHGAGFDNVDLAAMNRAGVIVANAPNAVRRPVALMAITFILALAHKLLLKDRLTREGRWDERGRHIGPGVTGLVVGIAGSGGVGLETARLCQAVGLDVVFARSPRNGDLERQGYPLLTLDEMLAYADFVLLACRLTEETRHMIDATRLRLMKPTAFLINVARGPVVDEPALIEVLQSGVIAGAGLDVFEQEPVDPSNPLLQMDNVVLAPHHLCVTEETLQAIADEVAEALAAVETGRVPANLINPEALEHPRVRDWLAGTKPQKA